jgi:tetratricopeptide (TPR) repeat protein
MSRVFLAEEVRLGRKVVIKVLPPEMAAGVSVDRFEREIQLAAKLQHPHVVPLLTAGSSDDLLYYIMPFIEGESLRAKLAREGELPVAEVLKILRDVLDALAYAHRHHVVHRDIKPDNVLLSEGHALVTDFGVAKAVAESTGKHTLTSMGVALGTPAYMAPEQATADPHTDHRADIYAVGAMAYEMLSGRPPFAATTAQGMLAAHVTEAPEPVTKHRTTVPAALNELILKCLEKKPADRWQRADELIPQVAAMLTPTGGTTPTATKPYPAAEAAGAAEAAAPVDALRVAGLFVGASLVVLLVVYLIVQLVGLPDWVFAGAIALLAVGLPIMLLTSHHERRRAVARSSGRLTLTPSGGLTPHFTWRKAFLGGGLAFAVLGVVAAGYMAMRVLGIGPVGTLVATGVLDEGGAVILASFDNRANDTTLGPTVTELFRVGLAQSPVIKLVDQTRIGAILGRMQRPAGARVDRGLALEMAEREGLRAVIVGEIVPVGAGYGLTAQMLSASGGTLTAQQAAARDPGELFAAVEELSRKIRERFGESLRTIRRAQPLERVTTPSLAALRLYAQALAAENLGDEDRAVALLEEAIAEDTAFAMAYRKLGTILGNNFEQRTRATEAITRAHRHRDRLTEREAAYAAGMYFTRVTGERERAIAAYQSLLDRFPTDGIALNNTGVLFSQIHDYRRALEYYRRALAADSSVALYYSNIAFIQTVLRDFEGARAALDLLERRFPGNPRVLEYGGLLDFSRGAYDSAAAKIAALREAQRGNLGWREWTSRRLAELSGARGRLAESARHEADAQSVTAQRGVWGEYLATAVSGALQDLLLTGNKTRATQRVAAALRETPMDRIPVLDRPYWLLVWFHTAAGDPAAARRWVTEFRASGVAESSGDLARDLDEADALARLAEGRHAEAIATLQRVSPRNACEPCAWSLLARAYDVVGSADSSLALWERYVSRGARPSFLARTELPTAYRRLGELYEARGDRERALRHYADFVELWKDADPELQPVVTDVKRRMARLVGEGR